MNLYLIFQCENIGYGTYDVAVVAAPNEDEARRIHPDDVAKRYDDGVNDSWNTTWTQSWCRKPEQVAVKLIGTAAEGVLQGVVLASFNNG